MDGATLKRLKRGEAASVPHAVAIPESNLTETLEPARHPGVSLHQIFGAAATPRAMSEDRNAPRRRSGTSRKEPRVEEARLRQQAIGVRLRHMFEEVVNEPVPEDFLAILRRADRRDGGSDGDPL